VSHSQAVSLHYLYLCKYPCTSLISPHSPPHCPGALPVGAEINASRAVISNATLWDTIPMLPPGALPADWVVEAEETELCASFMHLHLGIEPQTLNPKP
jgi:hypothetical protein